MSTVQIASSATERSMRTVYIGNISSETKEEKLMEIFSKVGQVLSFSLVSDKDTGESKSYAFCEFKDQEIALVAVQTLNGYELNGKQLKVGIAVRFASEEPKGLKPPLCDSSVESTEKSPSSMSPILEAVNNLSQEQIIELIEQAKLDIPESSKSLKRYIVQLKEKNEMLEIAVKELEEQKLKFQELYEKTCHELEAMKNFKSAAEMLPDVDNDLVDENIFMDTDSELAKTQPGKSFVIEIIRPKNAVVLPKAGPEVPAYNMSHDLQVLMENLRYNFLNHCQIYDQKITSEEVVSWFKSLGVMKNKTKTIEFAFIYVARPRKQLDYKGFKKFLYNISCKWNMKARVEFYNKFTSRQ